MTDSRPSSSRRIVVTAAVIERDGTFLVTRRPSGVHLEGYWEFPGGKCEDGESHVESLAAAPEADVSATWRPLGYNVRPRRLHAIARESMERYGGELPGDEATLRSFKGIGAYTAGAVLSFAFGQRAAILDTNVARVLFRIFVGAGDPKSHAMRRHLWEVSRTVLPMRHVFDFNQALMDFGATLCTARKPQCPSCPMRAGCAAYPYDRP